jgi:hypothetical protein
VQKYKYEFVRVDYTFLAKNRMAPYREEVERRAADGWRFVTSVLPPDFMTGGKFELVFEKEVSEAG